jgi:RND family efflux transporter MFP subunit
MLAAAGALWGSGVADRRTLAPGGWGAADVRPAGPDRDRTPDRRSAPVVAEGRLAAYPGAEVVVGCELAGTVVEMPVNEKSSVRKGDLIAALRADDLRASRAETAARVAEAEANIRLFERELSRAERLSTRAVASSSEVESHRRDLDAARARRAAALAAGAYLDALLAKSRVVAPIDGTVIARHAHPGETLALGARLVTVVDMSRVRVEAEVDEYDSGRVAPGAPVTVTAEGFPGATWRAKVEEIPDAVTPRRIRPEDPGRPSDTRVLLVKIALEERTPLKLGQRVEVEIRAAKSAEAR